MSAGMRRPWWKRWWAIVIGTVMALGVIGALIPADEKPSPTAAPPVQAATVTVTATPAVEAVTVEAAATTSTDPPAEPEPEPEPAEKPSFEGDGQYIVGTDIEPGTYRTRDSGDGCYWARLAGFEGSLDDIVANTNTSAPTIVTISRRDKGFETSRCGTFTKDLSRITDSTTSFGDGTFIVGTDIEPGRYRSTGGDGCYLARLSGFGGTLEAIIANANPSGRAVITIRRSDKGFYSERCGTWTRG